MATKKVKRATRPRKGRVAVAKAERSAGLPSVSANAVIRVRMYRHGLGDCHLIRLPKTEGPDTYNILIDCGLIAAAKNPKPIMQKVVTDIAKSCNNRLDLVVMTHEHWDHVSGFSEQQAQKAFDHIDIGEVWYAWTEDPGNALGRKLRRERASKVRALQRAAIALERRGTPIATQRASRIGSLLRFFGYQTPEDPELTLPAVHGGKKTSISKTLPAFQYPGQRHGVKVRYCRPDDAPVRFNGVQGVQAYVLGPPEDEGRIKRSAPTKSGREVYEFSVDMAFDDSLSAAFERILGSGVDSEDKGCPFDSALRRQTNGRDTQPSEKLQALIDNLYLPPDESWRAIDDDWTAVAETLALNLDSHTNNTCLVIAFELENNGKVLLFAADAQVGNWLSWQDLRWQVRDKGGAREVTGPDLLRRTVFYKVGHHGSHNATLRALGLEQMTSRELIAFVPVVKDQAEASGWHKMPFPPLVKRLREKTRGRLVLTDPNEPAPSADDLATLSQTERKEFLAGLTINELYYEYTFQL